MADDQWLAGFRRSDEAGDKLARRRSIKFHGRTDRLDISLAQDDDPVGQRHGFDLAAGRLNDGRQPFMQHS